MKQIDTETYVAKPGEIITIDVAVGKRPFLVAFQDPPDGVSWEQVSRNELSERRSFSMPRGSGAVVRFAAQFDEATQAGDPDSNSHYDVTISGSHGGFNRHTIVLAKGKGPRTVIYEFETDYPGPS
jgi:hypothetical protein